MCTMFLHIGITSKNHENEAYLNNNILLKNGTFSKIKKLCTQCYIIQYFI